MQIDKLRDQNLDQLFDAILSLKDREECYRFFDDLATMNEIQSLTQRLTVAKMLNEGETYQVIADKSKASTTTISRVKRSLTYGSGGYQLVLDRLKKEKKGEQSL